MKKISTSERLKFLIKQRKLKQVDILELAKPYCKKHDIKLHKNDLSQYVNGKVEPGQDKLFILASALNVSEAWLLGYDVPMERVFNKNTIENQTELSIEDAILQKLCSNYILLNTQGREKLLAYSEDLIGNIKYTVTSKKEKRA